MCAGCARLQGPECSMKHPSIHTQRSMGHWKTGDLSYRGGLGRVPTVYLSQLDSVCINGLAGQGKPSRR